MNQRAEDIMRARAASTTHPRTWTRTRAEIAPANADRQITQALKSLLQHRLRSERTAKRAVRRLEER